MKKFLGLLELHASTANFIFFITPSSTTYTVIIRHKKQITFSPFQSKKPLHAIVFLSFADKKQSQFLVPAEVNYHLSSERNYFYLIKI